MSDGTCLFVFFRKKSEVLESAAFCISRAVGTGTLYLNRRGCTFTVTVIGAIVGAVVTKYLDVKSVFIASALLIIPFIMMFKSSENVEYI